MGQLLEAVFVDILEFHRRALKFFKKRGEYNHEPRMRRLSAMMLLLRSAKLTRDGSFFVTLSRPL